MSEPILQIKNLAKSFPITGGFFRRQIGSLKAVQDVSFSVGKGETIGIVGESGCGKTTLGRTIIRLYEPTMGQIVFDGTDITHMSQKELKPLRHKIQMIFQDPFGSLNPRMRVEDILTEPFIIHNMGNKESRRKKISSLLDRVGLDQKSLSRYPHEFSGGQRQRICIARALTLEPELIIADEPVAALDVSIQSQVLNLLVDLQKELKLTYIFISHDLNVVHYIADKIAVMYLGKIVEIGTPDEICQEPKHPYTQALMSSIPRVENFSKQIAQPIKGDIPSPSHIPLGCSFHPRCPAVMEKCSQLTPREVVIENRKIFCHLYEGPDGEKKKAIH